MAEATIIIGNKDGKSYHKNIELSLLLGRKIGETIKGELIGFSDYEFILTGGSDDCGFPMRPGLRGARRAKILARGGVGVRKNRNGDYIRKTVYGESIGEKIKQINLMVVKEGSKNLQSLFGIESKEVKADENKNN